jgi:hypothetical protein
MTTLTRSTLAITQFVQASRRLAALAMQMKQAESELAALRDDVLDQIGEGRTVKVDGALATLTRREKVSYSRTCDDQTAVEFCRSHGLKYQERSSEYVAPASWSAYCRNGQIDSSLYDESVTVDVNVI